MTAPTPITALPDAPVRGEAPTTFSTKANAFVAALPGFVTETNAVGTVTYNNALDSAQSVTDCEAQVALAEAQVTLAENQVTLATAQVALATTQANLAETYAGSIASNVNFVGNWADQTGAAAVPYSVYHNLRYWQLLVNLADVTASEPSQASNDWALSGGDVGVETAKSLVANEERGILMATLPTVPILSALKETAQVAVESAYWHMTVDDASFSYAAPVEINNGITIDTSGVYAGTHVASTTDAGQVDTTNWTDINSAAITETLNGGTISYAMSVDGRDTWFVVRNSLGARSIIRNNLGTYEYNSNTDYASETWTAASVNTLQGAVDDAALLESGWGLTVATYESISFNVSLQENQPQAVFFKSDGTKMYVVGIANDTVYQYTLPTPWVLTGASYDSVSFSVSSQSPNPYGMFFKDDGTKMYVLDRNSNTVHQYSLPTPWVLTGASYDSVSFSVSPASAPQGMFFKSDGTKLYLIQGSTSIVYQYTLPTPWVLTGASYDSVSFSVNAQETNAQAVSFKDDGTKMYVLGASSDSVHQYSLPTPWVLTGATYDSVAFSVNAQEANATGMLFGDDGKKMYVLGFSRHVFQYSVLDTPNVMDSSILAAATDADFSAVTTTMDFLAALTAASVTPPVFTALTFNYDANATDQLAIPGTDYTWTYPAEGQVNFKALTAGNYKIRVI